MTVEREDILIGRVVDGEAAPNDWIELEQLAARDAGVWRRLAVAQREQASLCAGFEEAIEVADRVEIPHHAVHAAHSFNMRWRAWSGWAAAAAVALVWATTQGLLPNNGAAGGQQANIAGNLSPDEAFNEYLTTGMEEGRVLGELPSIMVDSSPAEDGDGIDVTIMRRIIEVKRVKGAFSIGVDENGEVRLAPAPAVTEGESL